MKRCLLLLTALAVLGIAAAVGMLRTGVYNVAATEQHIEPTYRLLEIGMRASVRQRANAIAVPAIEDAATIASGYTLYREHCVQCHGAPGVAPAPFALGLNPPPANLAYTAREWPAQELYWVVKHGIRMTGMPAWDYRMSESELWAVVAFLRRMPLLTPDEYAKLQPDERNAAVAGSAPPPGRPDAGRGARALQQYACITCHEIPGVVGAAVPVGPPLAAYARRQFVAGALPNTPDNLVRWLRDPRGVNPRTAMPDLGINEADARDIAAFLYALD